VTSSLTRTGGTSQVLLGFTPFGYDGVNSSRSSSRDSKPPAADGKPGRGVWHRLLAAGTCVGQGGVAALSCASTCVSWRSSSIRRRTGLFIESSDYAILPLRAGLRPEVLRPRVRLRSVPFPTHSGRRAGPTRPWWCIRIISPARNCASPLPKPRRQASLRPALDGSSTPHSARVDRRASPRARALGGERARRRFDLANIRAGATKGS